MDLVLGIELHVRIWGKSDLESSATWPSSPAHTARATQAPHRAYPGGPGVFALGAAASGVELVGAVPTGLPSLHLPGVGYAAGQAIGMEAVGLVIVSFTSGMLTARSFAARNGYARSTRTRSFGPSASPTWSGDCRAASPPPARIRAPPSMTPRVARPSSSPCSPRSRPAPSRCFLPPSSVICHKRRSRRC